MAFLSFQNEIRFRKLTRAAVSFLLKSSWGLGSLYPFSFSGPCLPAIHGELLVVHFKIFPACFGSLTAKTTSCFFEPASDPV
jgi:hypothetical protein